MTIASKHFMGTHENCLQICSGYSLEFLLFEFPHSEAFWSENTVWCKNNKTNISLAYRIWPNYCTVCLGFSKLPGKRVVKYVSAYVGYTLTKDLKRTYLMMFMQFFFWFSIYKHMLYVLIWIASMPCRCNSNGYPQHIPLKRSRQKIYWL